MSNPGHASQATTTTTVQSKPAPSSGHATAPLAVGTRLPDFTLKLATKDGPQDFNLNQNLGNGPLVFAFFPLAFSGTCTKEVCDMRDNLAQLEGKGAKVFGFSADSHFTNVEFAKLHNATYGILSDPNRDVIGRIWPTATVAGIHNVAKRGVMLVNPDGTVKWTSVSDDPKVWIGAQEVGKHI